MTRGRKKDLTIPPTRALSQQRAYRDRRAKYVAELEERCRLFEEENVKLREELNAARTSSRVAQTQNVPDISQVSSDLLQQLLGVSASIVRYQQLVFGQTGPESPPLQEQLHPAPSQILSMMQALPTALPVPAKPERFNGTHNGDGIIPQLHLTSPSIVPHFASTTSIAEPFPSDLGMESHPHQDSESEESECCGGIINCDGLVEENIQACRTAARTSDIRSGTQPLPQTKFPGLSDVTASGGCC